MIVRIYTGQDGQTHFEDLPLTADESQNVALPAGASLTFRRFPADYFSDWHTAPRRSTSLYSRGRWKLGLAMAPRGGLDPVIWSSLMTSKAGAYDALGGRSADQCYCAGERLTRCCRSSGVE